MLPNHFLFCPSNATVELLNPTITSSNRIIFPLIFPLIPLSSRFKALIRLNILRLLCIRNIHPWKLFVCNNPNFKSHLKLTFLTFTPNTYPQILLNVLSHRFSQYTIMKCYMITCVIAWCYPKKEGFLKVSLVDPCSGIYTMQ